MNGPKFKIKVQKSHLFRFIKPINKISSEAVLVFHEDMITSKTVDPAHVAVIDIEIGEDAMEEYDVPSVVEEEVTLAISVYRLKKFLRHFDMSDYVSIYCDGGEEVKVRGKKDKIAISDSLEVLDPESVTDPTLPSFKSLVSFELENSDLRETIKIATDYSDHLEVTFEDGKVLIDNYDSDTGEMMENGVSYVDEDPKIFKDESEGSVKSSFALDHLQDFSKSIRKSRTLKVTLKDDYPMGINWENSKSSIKAFYGLAPRIEMD